MRRAALARADDEIVPEDDLLRRVEARPDLEDRGGVERVEEELLLAAPDHAHRPPRGHRQTGGLDGLLGRALAAEPAADVRRDDAHLLGREVQGPRDLRLERERRLRAGPHRDLAVLDRGHGRVRLHRRVRGVVVQVRLLEDLRRQLLTGTQAAAFRDGVARGRGFDQMIVDRRVAQRGRGRLEGRLDQVERLVGLVAVLVQDGHEVAVADHAHARHGFGGRRVGALQRRAVGRRAQDARVQRAGRHDVAGVLRLAGDLLHRVAARRRRAHDREVRDLLERRPAVETPLDARARGQLAVAHALRAIGPGHDHAVAPLEVAGGHLQPLGGHLHQDCPRLGGGRAQHGAELPDAQRPERAHVPRTQVGVAHDDVHGHQRDVQLLGGELGQRRHRALPHLDLADEARDTAVGTDVQVGVQVGGIALAARGKPGWLLPADKRLDREDHEQARRGQLQEAAPVDGLDKSPAGWQLDGVVWPDHRAPPAIAMAVAAVSMACTTRTCAPHRQRWSSICRTMSARVGLGFLSSNAYAPRIMPGVQ